VKTRVERPGGGRQIERQCKCKCNGSGLKGRLELVQGVFGAAKAKLEWATGTVGPANRQVCDWTGDEAWGGLMLAMGWDGMGWDGMKMKGL